LPTDRFTAQEGNQDGPKVRGAAGTPHNIALARAIAEAQLSPLQVCPKSCVHIARDRLSFIALNALDFEYFLLPVSVQFLHIFRYMHAKLL